ncbi:TPA: YopT-type cysteine protease domain-containing protein [Enterobacter hormaechei]
MSIINLSAFRRAFDLNISSSELKKIDKMNLKKVSNSTIYLLERTLVTSYNVAKRQKIQCLMERISAVKNEDILSRQHHQTRNDISELTKLQVVKFRLQEQEANNHSIPFKSDSLSIVKNKPSDLSSKEKTLKILQLLGVNTNTFPNTYGDLLSVVKNSFDDDFSRKFSASFKKIDLERKMTPKLTQKVIDKLSMSPTCLNNVAKHFNGMLNVKFSQSDGVLNKVQVGKDGLCSSLSFKWCADKIQGIPFFEDIKTTEGLNEVVSLKVFKGSALKNYLIDRNLYLLDDSRNLNFEDNSVNVITMNPHLEPTLDGHAVATYINIDKQLYEYFDSNIGEFSFPSSENMKNFFDAYTSICYPDLGLKSQIIFSG